MRQGLVILGVAGKVLLGQLLIGYACAIWIWDSAALFPREAKAPFLACLVGTKGNCSQADWEMDPWKGGQGNLVAF